MAFRPLRQAAALAAPWIASASGQSARRTLEKRFAPLGGASTKVAQLLAARDGRDGGAELKPLPWDRLVRAAGPEAAELLERFFEQPGQVDPQGRRASLSQVHRAVTNAGQDVAVKILLPGVERALRSDLRVAGWAGRRAAPRRLGLEVTTVNEWVDATGNELLGELDLEAESHQQTLFRGALRSQEGVRVPEPLASTRGLLLAEWQGGASLSEAMQWPRPLRETLGSRAANGILEPLFGAGLAHGDLHPGNVSFRQSHGGELVLYDFGATRTLPQTHASHWERIVLDPDADPWPLALELGFDPARLGPIRSELRELCATIFAPLRGESLGAAERKSRVDQLLGDHRLAPRLAAPTAAIPVVRTLAGLMGLLGHLNVCVDRRRSSHAPRPRAAAERHAAALVLVRSRDDDGRGVELRLPFRALLELDSLLPERARTAAREAGIDLGARAREAHALGPQPTTLVDQRIGDRHVHIAVLVSDQ